MNKKRTLISLAAEMARGDGMPSDDVFDYSGPLWFRRRMAQQAGAAREIAKLWAIALRDLLDEERAESNKKKRHKKLSRVPLPYWHEMRKLSWLQDFVGDYCIDQWRHKYLTLRIDMRNGAFSIIEGNTVDPSFLMLDEEGE